MANLDENFVVKTGLTVGPTTITATSGNIATTGNVTVGTTVIEGTSGNIHVGPTVINGITGEINTTANVTTTSNFIVGTTVLSATGAVTTNNITTTGGTINGTVIGATTPSTAKFTTLEATGNVTVSSDILPLTTNVSNIGSPTQRFSKIYVNEALLSVNTLFLGDTAILGTNNNTVNIHTDLNQALSIQTSGAAGTMALVSGSQMSMQTTGNNADILFQSNGTGSKTRILSATETNITAPTISFNGNTIQSGSETINGDLTVQGNVSVLGSTAALDVAGLTVKDDVIILNSAETGTGVTSGKSGVQFARGQLGSYQLVFQESDQSLQFGPIGLTKAVVLKDGTGSIISDVTGNVTGSAATVTAASQPAITSVGTLTSLAVSGEAAVGNLTVSGNLTVNGSSTTINATTLDVADKNITIAVGSATASAANGAGLTIDGANATMTYVSATDNFAFNKRVDATSFYGSGAGLTSIPNSAITNSSVTVTAGAGLSGGGAVSLGGSVTLANAGVTQLTGGGGVSVSGSTGAITLNTTATAGNVASSIVSRDASGNFSAGIITATLSGNVTGAVTGNASTATALQTARTISLSGNVTGSVSFSGIADANIVATVADNSHNHTSANISDATALNTANMIVKRDGFGGFSAGVITATATNARYADLAEKYTADAEYEPGTVVSFGGDAEVTLSVNDGCRKVAGVVTTAPAYLMNAELEGTVAAVALHGRVPCRVVGKVAKGDMLVSAGNGAARTEVEPKMGQVIGKALEDFTGDEGVIEVVVGRM